MHKCTYTSGKNMLPNRNGCDVGSCPNSYTTDLIFDPPASNSWFGLSILFRQSLNTGLGHFCPILYSVEASGLY